MLVISLRKALLVYRRVRLDVHKVRLLMWVCGLLYLVVVLRMALFKVLGMVLVLLPMLYLM